MKLKLVQPDVKIYTKEYCLCEFYDYKSNPGPVQTCTYSDWKYRQCISCYAKYPKDPSERACLKCKGRMLKCSFDTRINFSYFGSFHRPARPQDTGYFHFCPHCFPPVKTLISASGISPRFRCEVKELKPYHRGLLTDLTTISQRPELLDRTSLLLYGPTGDGKTTHACALGMSLMRQHLLRVSYLQVSTFLNRLKTLFGSGDSVDKEELRTLVDLKMSRGLVILDDFNRQYTEWENQAIYDIVDYRYSRHLPCIFTTQFEDMEAAKILPAQTASRIMQMCDAYNLGSTNLRIA